MRNVTMFYLSSVLRNITTVG